MAFVIRFDLFACALVAAACGSDGDASSGPGGGGAGGGGADAGTGAGGSGEGGSGGSAPQHPADPCEEHATRASCCADSACGWHHLTGHSIWFAVKPCVDRERVCEVDGVAVRECPEGMICHVDGAWETEDDCAALPPEGVIHLLGRGICVWPESAKGPKGP